MRHPHIPVYCAVTEQVTIPLSEPMRHPHIPVYCALARVVELLCL